MSLTPKRVQFSNAITCPGCGKIGNVYWEENATPSERGLERSLIRVSDGFRHDPQLHKGRDPAIICTDCGTQQQD